MISDHWRDKYPNPPLNPWQGMPFSGGYYLTAEQWNEYLDLKTKAEKYDRDTGQPDCVKPEVDAWEKAIEAYLKKVGLLPNDPHP